MKNSLRKCPFCGKNPEVVLIMPNEERHVVSTKTGYYAVWCEECDLVYGYEIKNGTGCFFSEEEAVMNWNKRKK